MYIRANKSPNSPRKAIQIVESVRHGKSVSTRIIQHIGVAYSDEEVQQMRALGAKIIESLEKRRSYYSIGKELPVSEAQVTALVEKLAELVPDAFNMKSSRVVVALGEKQDMLWNTVYDAFGGKVAREKIDSFRAGAGTVLYFYDEAVVQALQAQFPLYAANFPGWALQSSGMLQLSVWSGLRELGVGASLQHYNPIIDKDVRALFGLPESYRLVAQMPFGSIKDEPEPKEKEDISLRVTTVR